MSRDRLLRTRRLARVVVLVAVVVAVTVAVVGSPASAQTGGGGELGPDYVRATARDLGAGTFPGTSLPTRTPSEVSPYTWVRRTDRRWCVVFGSPWPPELAVHVTPRPVGIANGVPLLPAGELVGDRPSAWLLDDLTLLPDDATVVGPLVWDFGRPTSGGGGLVILPWCPAPGTPAPWEAPTAAEIWEQTPLPRRPIAASPPGTRDWPGITQMATSFRSDARPPTTAAVSLRGFDVTVTAVPIAYAWTLGDGSVRYADAPPSTSVRYRRRGDYSVTLYVVWEAHAHVVFAPWRLDIGNVDLGTVTLPETRGYHVGEVRAVLRTTPGGR